MGLTKMAGKLIDASALTDVNSCRPTPTSSPRSGLLEASLAFVERHGGGHAVASSSERLPLPRLASQVREKTAVGSVVTGSCREGVLSEYFFFVGAGP